MDFVSHNLAGCMDSYESYEQIDFRVIPSKMKKLPFYEDDLYLGMQVMNVGIVDQIITQQEYVLLNEYNLIEKIPDNTMAVSALSQMWIYSLYEVLRMWRERKCEFEKLNANGGIDLKIKNMASESQNLTIGSRKKQMLRFKNETEFRQ